ncbi:MAG: nitrogen fixation protein NifQ, partial [Desulfuromonadaceae bacterium]
DVPLFPAGHGQQTGEQMAVFRADPGGCGGGHQVLVEGLLRRSGGMLRLLLAATAPPGIGPEDRHLFACLLTVASREQRDIAAALGLPADDLEALLSRCFPACDLQQLSGPKAPPDQAIPASNSEVRDLLLSHVPRDETGTPRQLSRWLALALAARAAQPGHLWVAMGLLQRPELSAAIARRLPSLAAANDKGMRWKRYLFREVCKLNGGLLCKSPNCGVCSDYALCFGSD